MRSPRLLLISIILLPLLTAAGVQAQPTPHYITLYAHSYRGQAILNALPQPTGQKTADISKEITFRLTPVLGDNLHIYGAITFTIYLRASNFFFGTVGLRLAELPERGTEIAVPAATADTGPIRLGTAVLPVTVGVGIIDYQFRTGSAIVLHIGVLQTSGSGTPMLVWDDPAAPTSLRLPTLSPTTADLSLEGEPSFGRIFQADARGGAEQYRKSTRRQSTMQSALTVSHTFPFS